ncbi:MAG: hypothetical protein IT305_32120 [Chloroflexi bacterium]|nr:hypothetical protein [Chloroflexota bacterium]
MSDAPPFDRWDADDALEALYRAGLHIDQVQQARWPAKAPQPRTHRQAFTFVSPGAIDPHLLLVFDTPEALEAWRLWLMRYWRARPYLSIRDNLLLLVSRELTPEAAQPFHQALARLGTPPPGATEIPQTSAQSPHAPAQPSQVLAQPAEPPQATARPAESG